MCTNEIVMHDTGGLQSRLSSCLNMNIHLFPFTFLQVRAFGEKKIKLILQIIVPRLSLFLSTGSVL